MKRYNVHVGRYSDGTQKGVRFSRTAGLVRSLRVETHRADSWQSAVLSHSWIGAEFEGLEDEEDLEKRAAKYGLYIEVEELYND